MLNRKIMNDIQKWYFDMDTALLIDGARQIGKTTVIENFLKKNQLDYLEINLLENEAAREAFNTSKDSEQLLIRLTTLSRKPLIPQKTIIFIDEIQEASDAITPIKFLVQDKRFRFIFSGSLLGVKMQNIASVPVGFLKILQMYPMDFEEFCQSMSVSDMTLKMIKECYDSGTPVDEIVHNQMMTLFNLYLVVGGMPKAVSRFVETKDISIVNDVLNDINTGYLLDISKYEKKNQLLIQDIYELIPSELNSQNKRFILKDLNENARFYKYETSFVWLKNSAVGLFVHNVDNPKYPLLASKERTLFKLFLCDVGLLSSKLYNENQIQILNGNSNLNNGAIYEAVVAQELKAHGFELYYNSDKKRGEIDFLIEKNNEVIPIEVKSGKDYKRHSALSQLLTNKEYNIKNGMIFCNGNVKWENDRRYYPIYMIMFVNNEKNNSSTVIDFDISKLI